RWHALSRVERESTMNGTRVRHPRFLVVPRVPWFTGLAYALAIRSDLRRLGVERRHVLLHGHCLYPDGVGVALAARWLRSPYLLTAHGSDVNVYAAKPALRPQIRWSLRGASGVITVSGPIRRRVLELIGEAGPQVEHIPCAGSAPAGFGQLDRAEARRQLGLPAGGRVVLFVGNLVPLKAVDRLLDAWAFLLRDGFAAPEDRLVIVGDGPCRGPLEARAQSLAPSVIFAGGLPHAQIPARMSASDLLCLVSREEGTPNVVVEALASGVPVVATAVGGVPELIDDGRNGMLVSGGEAEDIARTIREALRRDWEPSRLRASVAHLTWDSLARQNLEFIAS